MARREGPTHPPAASPHPPVSNAQREVSTQINENTENPDAVPGVRTSSDLARHQAEVDRKDALRGFPKESELSPGEKKILDEATVSPEESEKKLELAQEEAKFMKSVADVAAMANHDDDCAQRKGKECGCRDNLRALRMGELKELEEKHCAWTTKVWRKKPLEPLEVQEKARLVRVDEGRQVARVIPDPLSPHLNKPITVFDFQPPRWICVDCAASMRGTDIDHHCDDAVKNRAQRPIGLERMLAPEVRFGGAYRLILWRDRAGEYHLGEQVVAGERVVEERHLYGPDAYNIIEGALLDAAVTKLAP